MGKTAVSQLKARAAAAAYRRRSIALVSAGLLAAVTLTVVATSLAAGAKTSVETELGKIILPAARVRASTASSGQAVRFSSGAVSASAPSGTINSGATTPSALLSLSNWYLTLPLPGPLTVKQPELANYTKDPYFKFNANKTGVVFNAPVEGDTTANSTHTRTELRETDSSGKLPWGWPAGTGSHTMTATESITHLPGNDGVIGFAQIHGPGSTWYLILLATGNGDGTAKLSVKDNTGKADKMLIDPSYVLGTKFELKVSAINGAVTISYNGKQKVSTTSDQEDCYFKIGAYNQSDGDYGEVQLFQLAVSHR